MHLRQHIQKATAVLLSLLLLLSAAGCKNLPPPSRTTPGNQLSVIQQFSEPVQAATDGQEAPGGSVGVEEATTEIAHTAVRRVIVDPEKFEIARGSSIDPYIFILPTDASDKSYTLRSEDESVLRQLDGRWTAVGAGTTELVATASNGITGRATVIVTIPAEELLLELSEISLNRGESVTLEVLVLPDDATDQNVRYRSSNTNVATVSEDGTIQAVGAGEAQIHVSLGNVRESLLITVFEPVTAIFISMDKRIYQVGDTGRFTVRVTPENSSDRSFAVSLSRNSITLGSDNTFTCDAGGEVTITVTASNGVTGSQTITIIDISAFAEEVFLLTNVERTNAGLSMFSARAELTYVAEVRAEEIIRHFSHDRPDGRGFETVFADNEVSYRYAGENLAAGQRTPAEVVRGWMNSPGHRDNMLRREYGHLGVAVAMDSNGRLYWTQMFTN